MKIGILSDTHDHSGNMVRALNLFQREGITTIIHCGDLTSPQLIQHMEGFRVIYVYGNMDFNPYEISQALQKLNTDNFVGTTYRGKIDDVAIAATHSHLPGALDGLVRLNDYRYVFHGHTHRQRNEMKGKTQIINPGALGGAGKGEPRTVCIVDLATEEVVFHEISKR